MTAPTHTRGKATPATAPITELADRVHRMRAELDWIHDRLMELADTLEPTEPSPLEQLRERGAAQRQAALDFLEETTAAECGTDPTTHKD